MRPLGSVTFKTTVIRADEYVLMANVMKENGDNNVEIFLQIQAIDDMLQLLRIQSLILNFSRTRGGKIRKNSTLSSLIEHRLDKLVNDLKPETEIV